MTKPKRTHPLGLLLHIAHSIKDYWYLLILLISLYKQPVWFALGWVLVIIAILVWPIIRWATLSYRVTPQAVEINSGVFVRHHEHIPYARIQTVQRKQWFFLAPFKLEEVSIETASHDDNKPEARLAAVPTTLADQIDHYRQGTPATETATTETVRAAPNPDATETTASPEQPAVEIPAAAHYRINNRTLFKFAVTSTGFIPLLLILLALYNKIPRSWTDTLISDATHLALIILVAGALVVILIAWVGAFLWTYLRYYHFDVTLQGDQLKTAKGFFQRNTITAPLRRIQAIRIKQNVFRQWLHIQTVQVLLASKAASEDDDDDLVILPAVPQAQLYDVAPDFLGWLPDHTPDLGDLNVADRRKWYLVRNALLVALVPVAIATWFWPHLWWLFALVLVLAYFQGLFAARQTGGHLMTPTMLALQTGHVWTKETYYLPAEMIQSMRLEQSVWMKRKQLMHLIVNVRHGNKNQSIELRYLRAEQAQRIYDWYLHTV
ncbi:MULTISPECIES: PH domain-containing protein [Lactobacillaceae]|uniref:PH domain-containing protein n=1 Tax=Lactobacillaceae TaxID=33958 RepID=UPI0014568BBB|nr:PH domain-containing protein [Lactobacillus sp. HBUAS51381]NLR08496.1 PH domain-containing protein [Lactobacillus sp. HBUAS51381]